MPIEVVSTEATQTQATAEKSAEVVKNTEAETPKETPELVAQDAIETDEDNSEGPENEEEESDSKEAAIEKPKKSGSQRRKEKIEKQRLEIEFLREQLLKTAPQKADQSVQEKPVQKAEGKPDPNDPKYENYEQYLADLVDWTAEQKLTAKERKANEEKLKAEIETKTETFKTRLNEFAEKHEDYDDVAESVADVRIPLTLWNHIQESENGIELWYQLAKTDVAEYKRICSLPPSQQMIAVGKFEARLESQKSTPQKETKVSKAPAPISPVGAKSSGSVKKSIYDPNISQAEFEAVVREQEKRRSAWG